MVGAELDWGVVAGAVGTFIGAVFLTIKGWQKGKEEVKTESKAQIIGGTIQDNITMRDNTQAVHDLTHAVHEQTEVNRAVLAAITRHTDAVILIARKSD